jgi:hypothetical protein
MHRPAQCACTTILNLIPYTALCMRHRRIANSYSMYTCFQIHTHRYVCTCVFRNTLCARPCMHHTHTCTHHLLMYASHTHTCTHHLLMYASHTHTCTHHLLMYASHTHMHTPSSLPPKYAVFVHPVARHCLFFK